MFISRGLLNHNFLLEISLFCIHSNPLLLMESAELFFKRCTMFIRTTESHHLDVLTAALSLALDSISYRCIYAENTEKVSPTQSSLAALQEEVRKWMSKVIGGQVFGSSATHSQVLKKSAAEIKVHGWSILMGLAYLFFLTIYGSGVEVISVSQMF